ncbi:hypothetical protein [Arcobacter cloacae]|uniref:Uncharacterized protein n=1 Tax=Arcobacter cloacae TaxID=1054034 RepID=A0A6M8NHA2_9BACT|nr:hypothetical protein [Arcobacter cloacae]QKF89719.1 hypothetical protein ACLO_1218 [Arcobacter cloacae]RXI40716.1 hypothetical protein CP963_08030 [Arcobacter cloacae]
MYELQNINQNLLNDLIVNVVRLLKEKKYIYLIKAIEYAMKKELPHAPKQVIEPLIRKVQKILDLIKERTIITFDSEEDAQQQFKKEFGHLLDLADKNVFTDNWSKLIYDSYDLCKYDKKIIYQGNEFLYNTNYLIFTHHQHFKTYRKWEFENKIKPDEFNINISHNTNRDLESQTKFLKSTYELYNSNPYAQNPEKDLEQHLIDVYEEDRNITARSIQEIANIKYDVDTFKNKQYATIIKTFGNLKPYLNSDRVIEKTDIIFSWLTYVAMIYTKLNPQKIPATTLGKYITTVAKATTIFKDFDKDYIISLDKIREANFREIAIYNNLRIMQCTDKRLKLTYNEKTTLEIENYIKNIIFYIKKFKI